MTAIELTRAPRTFARRVRWVGGLLVVSYGLGLDSTAMLVEMRRRGIRPDLILFADTGGEKPETYAYLAIINAWLVGVGFPTVTVVRYAPVRAPYTTLEGKCLANETLPSLAFGGHSCALVFKRDVMVGYLKTWPPALAAIARGEKITKAIGYDASKADTRRRGKADRATDKIRLKIADRADCGKEPLADQWEVAHCTFAYFLQDWGLERAELAVIITAAGLPLPVKSACWFCPATHPDEVVQLRIDHPELYWRAVAMERRARNGRHGLTTKAGLGMGGWASHILWVDEDGEVHMTPWPEGVAPGQLGQHLKRLRFRYETSMAGNGYVGVKAAKDEGYVKRMLSHLVRDWREGLRGYSDDFESR